MRSEWGRNHKEGAMADAERRTGKGRRTDDVDHETLAQLTAEQLQLTSRLDQHLLGMHVEIEGRMVQLGADVSELLDAVKGPLVSHIGGVEGPDRDAELGLVGIVEADLREGITARTSIRDKVVSAVITAVGVIVGAWGAAAIGLLDLG